MKKKLLQMTAILSAALMLTGCSCVTNNNPGPIPQTDSSQTQNTNSPSSMGQGSVSLTAGKQGGMVVSTVPTDEQMTLISEAGTGLLAEIVSGSDENVLLSPTSILMALGMTENGASGDTLSHMEGIANGGVKVGQMNTVMAYLREKMIESPDVKWNVANSIWLKDIDDLELDPIFADTVIAHYRAEVWKSKFDQGTVDDINSWVNTNTDGMIDEVINNISPDTLMYLINAISFDGEWEEQYEDDKIKEGYDFNNADGSISSVTMLSSKENKYFMLGDGEGFVKPYKGGEFSFVGILPKEGESTSEYLNKIRDLDFAKAVREAKDEEVRVKIPEFENDYGTDLAKTYNNMGMTEPFGMNADFSDMLVSGGDEIYIGAIIHKTHIEVDRKGTRAAAVTAVDMRVKGAIMEEMPKSIVLDRPFVYAIVDNQTGLPVFLGCQNSMK